jgi:hypothetical protein
MLAPIVLFVYNRPQHTERTLRALAENELAKESVLYIYADGPKKNSNNEERNKINLTRKLIRSENWCKEVHILESETNKGLASSVIDGVTLTVNRFGKVIVLEDDLRTASGFLRYMNDALTKFGDEEKVMQVAGYCFPAHGITMKRSAFFMPTYTSWGWGTWKRAWNKFDPEAEGYQKLKTDKALAAKFDLDDAYPFSRMLVKQMETKDIDSWAIRWRWSLFKAGGIALFPDKSLVENIGFGSDGTHTRNTNPFPISNFDTGYSITDYPTYVRINEDYFEKVKAYIKQVVNGSVKKSNADTLLQRLVGRTLGILGLRKNKIS